jgi:hypothetical protein
VGAWTRGHKQGNPCAHARGRSSRRSRVGDPSSRGWTCMERSHRTPSHSHRASSGAPCVRPRGRQGNPERSNELCFLTAALPNRPDRQFSPASPPAPKLQPAFRRGDRELEPVHQRRPNAAAPRALPQTTNLQPPTRVQARRPRAGTRTSTTSTTSARSPRP